jgi:hypothetical protein
MTFLETTNERVARLLSEVDELREWAIADAEHSDESGAPEQAGCDRNRAMTIGQILQLLKSCYK